MSKLTYRFSLMINMTENELKEYIKTFTDNDKGMIILAFIKMFQFNVNTIEVKWYIAEWIYRQTNVLSTYVLLNPYHGCSHDKSVCNLC